VVSLGKACRYTLTGSANNNWYGPNGLPAISSDVTIEGNGATVARNADSPFRFFFVGADPASASTLHYVTPGAGRLTLRDLTLENGLEQGGFSYGGGGGAGMGGAIFNQGTVILERTSLVANTAQGGAAGVPDPNLGPNYGGGGIGNKAFGNELGGGFGTSSPPTAYPNGGSGGTSGNGLGGGGGAGFAENENGSNGTADAMNNRKGGNGGAATGGQTGLGGSRGGGANGTGGFGGDGSGAGGGQPSGGGGGPGGGFGSGGGGGFSLQGFGGGGGVGGGGGSGTGTGGAGGGGFGGGGGSTGDQGDGITGPAGDGGFGGGGGAGCPACNPVGGSAGFGGGAGQASAAGGGAGMGGAIFNMQGTVQVRNSTLSGNFALPGAGAADNQGQGLGGAVFNLSGSVTADGSTFAANSAAGGGASLYNLVYDSVTVRQAQMTLRDTIVSDAAGVDLVADNPLFTSATFNHGSSVADVSAFDLVRTKETRGVNSAGITGSPLTSDPLLGPLADNGGLTRTMAPSAGSPVIDAGSAFGLTTDQRGLPRPVDTPGVANAADGSDIGAVEIQLPPSTGGGGQTGGGQTGGGQGATVATASRLTIAPRSFPAAATGPSARASAKRRKPRPTGATVRFRLNVAATVRFTVQRSTSGRRVGKSCVALKRSNRKRRHCTRFVAVRGSFTRTGAAGSSRFRFTGRLGGHKLAPGSYRLVATPRAGGRAGHATRTTFRIVR
jgi:hypothetical protein